jgi:glycosyltransferase involved in cell wall biosynthesis
MATASVVKGAPHQKLAEALLKLLRNPSMAREMGWNGRGQVAKNFEIRTVTLAYESLFDEYSPRDRSHTGG